MPHLTVAQNIFIGREPRRRPRFLLDERAINVKARELLDRLHLRVDPRARVSDLTVAVQQLIEIARALSLRSEVLIMDEPTAALRGGARARRYHALRGGARQPGATTRWGWHIPLRPSTVCGPVCSGSPDP